MQVRETMQQFKNAMQATCSSHHAKPAAYIDAHCHPAQAPEDAQTLAQLPLHGPSRTAATAHEHDALNNVWKGTASKNNRH